MREVIRTTESVMGKRIQLVDAPRRPGDPAPLVASSEKIGRELGWTPRFPDLRTIIQTAWKWQQTPLWIYKAIKSKPETV